MRPYISRSVDFQSPDNASLANFSNRIGQAVADAGNTRSLGSMSLTLLSAQAYSQSRNQLSATDRNRHASGYEDFMEGLEDALKGRGDDIFCVRGLALMGRNARSQQKGAEAALCLMVDNDQQSTLFEELNIIKSYFEDNYLPTPSLKPAKLHIAFGRVRLDKIATGKNKDPHVLIPSGLSIPRSVHVLPPVVRSYDG